MTSSQTRYIQYTLYIAYLSQLPDTSTTALYEYRNPTCIAASRETLLAISTPSMLCRCPLKAYNVLSNLQCVAVTLSYHLSRDPSGSSCRKCGQTVEKRFGVSSCKLLYVGYFCTRAQQGAVLHKLVPPCVADGPRGGSSSSSSDISTKASARFSNTVCVCVCVPTR